ncbi:hypothetical protein NDU88_001916 [Pleurodeles waltl]|uniref:Uncharacterized protein n=1 Tax=Pleurodeles waltl TaxID=8319 RepID=A0AAV7Q4I0_PLEWA|nr:hypothetical protein NDU88_001916 [Pleurodeles waltl]
MARRGLVQGNAHRGPGLVRGCAGRALQGVVCFSHNRSSCRLLAALEGVAMFFRPSREAHAVEGVAVGVGRCPGLKCCGLGERGVITCYADWGRIPTVPPCSGALPGEAASGRVRPGLWRWCGQAVVGLGVALHASGSVGEQCGTESELCRVPGCRHYLAKVVPPQCQKGVVLRKVLDKRHRHDAVSAALQLYSC